MGEEDNRSSVEDMEEGNSRPPEMEDDLEEKKLEENDRRRRGSENNSSDCTAEKSSAGERGESRGSQSETLASVQVSRSDYRLDVWKSPEVLLSEVPVEYSLQPLRATEELKDQVSTVHEDPLKGKSADSSQVRMMVPGGPSKLEPASTSVTESSSSILHPTLPGKEMQLVKNGYSPCLIDQDKQSSASPKPLSSVPMLKTPDGYNWRKYGQKQVKNLDGFRSYYRCTFSDCYAKKIECCDRSNRVIETVYRSNHNHDPPQKVNSAKEDRPALPLTPVNGRDVSTHTTQKIDDPVPSISSKEPLPAIDQIPQTKQQDSCGSDETTEINVKEDHVDGPEFKRRQKRSSTDELSSLPKAGKKPKYVVHAPGDVGISGDGYRWRKYGQKMVKGNTHPRNYYRCTSAGCPVRKHIEKAVDNTSELVITYKGVHDHDIPVPRKRHSTKSTPLLAATAANPVSADNLQTDKTKPCQNQTQWSVDKEGELKSEALNLEKGKTSDSAKTLLSIGFEIKPC